MDRFWGKITQPNDQLLPLPIQGVIMPKNTSDNAAILPLPDTHPSPWSWEINPTPTDLDDYKFPYRWATFGGAPFPIVVSNTWKFDKPARDTPAGFLRAIKTNYPVYPNHTRFVWRTTWNFLGGFLNDNRWSLRQDQYFSRLKGDFAPLLPYVVVIANAKTVLTWGLANAFTNEPTLYFRLETILLESFHELYAAAILSVWNGALKLAEIYLTTNYLSVQIDWHDGNATFSYRFAPDQPWFKLATTSFPSTNNQVCFFAHEFLGIYISDVEGGSEIQNYVDESFFEPQLVENYTSLLEGNHKVIVRTPPRMVAANCVVRLQATVPSALVLVRYHKNNTWHTPIYEGSHTWRVETGANPIPDFQWEVHAIPILESFRETETIGEGHPTSVPEYRVTFHPQICLNEANPLHITQTVEGEDIVWIQLKHGNEILSKTIVSRFPHEDSIINSATGELTLEIYSTVRDEVVYERTWYVYPCNAQPERAGRTIWTIGLVSEYPHEGRAEYTQSDREGKFYKESGMWYTEPN